MSYTLAFAGLYFHYQCLMDAGDARLRLGGIAAERHPEESLFFNPGTDPERLATERGVSLFPDATALLDAVDPDILAVFDVDARKSAVICEALRRNKHVIADKPICTQFAQFAEICDALRDSTGTLAILFPLTFLPIIRRLKALIDAGDLGDILAIRSRRAYIQRVSARPPWFLTKEYGGGIICDIGSHDLDLVRFLTGRDVVDAVAYAGNGKLTQFPTGEDYAQAIYRLDGNLLYSAQIDRVSPATATGDLCSLEVFGTRGQALIPQGYDQLVVTRENREPVMETDFAVGGYPELVTAYLDALDARHYTPPFFAPMVFGSVRGVLAAQHSADLGGIRVTVEEKAC